jgi:predicted ATPase
VGNYRGQHQALEALEQTILASLRQMIAAQFQQLLPEEQHLLEVASVAGVEFSAAAVAAGLAEPVIPVEAQCETPAQRGTFLEPRGMATWHDGTVAARYGFRYTLYQQVVYEGLPTGRRHQLHHRTMSFSIAEHDVCRRPRLVIVPRP